MQKPCTSNEKTFAKTITEGFIISEVTEIKVLVNFEAYKCVLYTVMLLGDQERRVQLCQ